MTLAEPEWKSEVNGVFIQLSVLSDDITLKKQVCAIWIFNVLGGSMFVFFVFHGSFRRFNQDFNLYFARLFKAQPQREFIAFFQRFFQT